MLGFRPIKEWVDTGFRAGEASAVHRLSLLLLIVAVPKPVAAQSNVSTTMWKVVDETLSTPAPLRVGPVAAFWNPASILAGQAVNAALEVVHTPEAVGISSIMGGVTTRLGRFVRAGFLFGRIEMSDLVRTTTSPSSVQGAIEIYDQLVGATVAAGLGRIDVGISFRTHKSRFDLESGASTTMDTGIRVRPTSFLTVAASTHLRPPGTDTRQSTEYLVAGEYRTSARFRDEVFQLRGRYGATVRKGGKVDHVFGGAATAADLLTVEATVARESGFGRKEWRPTVAVGLLIGKYELAVARSSGINGLSSTFRISLEMNFRR